MATLAEVAAAGDFAADSGLRTSSNTDPPLAGPSSSSAPDGTASEVDPGVDPYAAPPETVYPEGAVPNPCINSRNEPPHCLNLPKGALYRPAFFPADFDDRINLESIWMGLQKNTDKAVYFLPNACTRCAGNARFCDRGTPTCASCMGRPESCKPGNMWATLRPKPKPRISKATNYSALSTPVYNPFPAPMPGSLSGIAGASASGNGSGGGGLGQSPPRHQAAGPSRASVSPRAGTHNHSPSQYHGHGQPQTLAHVTLASSVYSSPTRPRADYGYASTSTHSTPSRQPPSAPLSFQQYMDQDAARPPISQLAGSPALPKLNGDRQHSNAQEQIQLDRPAAGPSTSPKIAQAASAPVASPDAAASASVPLPHLAQAETDRLGHNQEPEDALPEISTAVKVPSPDIDRSTDLLSPGHMVFPSVQKESAAERAAITAMSHSIAAESRPTLTRGLDSSDDEAIIADGPVQKRRRLSPGRASPRPVSTTTTAQDTPKASAVAAPKKRINRINHTQPAALTATSYPDDPLSSADAAYFERIEANQKRPAFKTMKHACPVWTNTRMALQASTEYFRSPRRTAGGSVEIGLGGVARGVILEGEAPKARHVWGAGLQIGTMILPLGNARPSRKHTTDRTVFQRESSHPTAPGRSSPRINILPDIRVVDPETGDVTIVESSDSTNTPKKASVVEDLREPEEDCVEALLVAQRATTPVALTVTKDYSLFPYSVPRGTCGLGWFWVVDAWTESADISSPDQPCTVQWMFRFEYCNGNSRLPWWQEEDEKTERINLPTLPASAKGVVVSGPGVSGCSTMRRADDEAHAESASEFAYRCSACNFVFNKVIEGEEMCLNEYCDRFMTSVDGAAAVYTPLGQPSPATLGPRFYMEPAPLGLKLRGVKPASPAVGVPVTEYGKDWWRGWICDKCGMANERKKWKQWECDGCKGSYTFLRTFIQLSSVRNPNRPICTGPRQDNGFPSFPYDVLSSWTLHSDTVSDTVKVVRHILPRTPTPRSLVDGSSGTIYHALHSGPAHLTTAAGPNILNRIWKDFQAQGPYEMRFKRNLLTKVSRRPFERYLCPYYTEAYGPFVPILTEALPSEPPTPWNQSPEPVLDLMDYINFRAGSMFADIPEFNSLLILVTPPPSINAYQPKFTVQKSDYLGLTCLGSECTIKIRRSCKGKAAELIMQHGDVLGVQAEKEDIELQLRPDGFGFIGIARQAYRSTPEPGLGAIYDPKKTETWRSLQAAEALSTSAPVDSGLGLTLGEALDIDAPAQATSAVELGISNEPPPVPTEYRENPLRDWYIGPRPLDTEQKERRGRPMFERAPEEEDEDDDDEDDDVRMNGEPGDDGPAGTAGPSGTNGYDTERPEASAGEDDDTELYDVDPGTPVLLVPDIPPSPTALDADEDEDPAIAAAEAQEKADKKAKRKKRQSEPAAAAAAGIEGGEGRAEKKQKRASEPYAKKDAPPGMAAMMSTIPMGPVNTAQRPSVEGDRRKGKGGKRKEAETGAEVNGAGDKEKEKEKEKGKRRKKAKVEPSQDVNGIEVAAHDRSSDKGRGGGKKAKQAEKEKSKEVPQTQSVTLDSVTAQIGNPAQQGAKQPRKRKVRPPGADPDLGSTPVGLGAATQASSPSAGGADTPVKLKLNMSKASDASSGPSRPSSALG